MSCCACQTKVKPMKPTKSPNDDDGEEGKRITDGPLKNRGCTDIVFLIFFILFIGGMGYVAYKGIYEGNPYRLIYGVDSWGNVCNQPNDKIPNVPAELTGIDMTGRKRLFYLDQNFFLSAVPTKDMLPGQKALASAVDSDSNSICISECPSEFLLTASDFNTYVTTNGNNLCRYDTPSYVADTSRCPSLPVRNSTELFNRCIPKDIISLFKKMSSFMITSAFSPIKLESNFTEQVVADMKNSWDVMLILCGIALGMSFIIVILMWLLAALLIWTLVIAVVALTSGAAAYCWYVWYSAHLIYEEKTNKTVEEQEEVRTWLVYSCIATTIAVIIMLVLLVMRKRIALVVLLFKEAGKALKRMPFLLLQPVWTMILLLGFVVILCVIAVYVETSGLPVVNNVTSKVVFEMDQTWRYLRWYHYFGMLWISAFVVACQDMVIAGAVATWYFHRDKSKLGCPILTSIGRTIRYHLGSIAFGSFIIALVRLARLILAYVQKQLKGKVNKIAEFLLKVFQCCLWCFEKFLAYLNRNAYIEIAIYGYNFCKAAHKAFLIIVANALRVAAINSIGDFVLFLGKLCTVAVVLVSGGLLLKDNENINYIWVPLTVGCAFGFVVSHIFLLVYEIVIDTIFLCFCEDCEMNDGETKPYFMSKDLMKYLNKARRESSDEVKTKSKDKSSNIKKAQDLSQV